jgi:small subunit ribosomal protein S3Ae
MAKGKNKKISKKAKNAKRGEKHPFLKKEWFTLISPSALKKTVPVGWTVCKKPTGTQVVSDFLKGRVAEISYADITENARDVTKKVKMVVDEIQGNICATSFYGFELSKEKIFAMLKKRQSLIEVYTDVRCNDAVILRIFLVMTTSRKPNQVKLNSYAKQSTIRLLRKKLVTELVQYAATKTSDDFAYEAISGVLTTKLEKSACEVVPEIKLQISKMKTVKRGNVDLRKILEGAQASIKPTGETKLDERPEAVNTLTAQQE